jgi:hypothetical protein
MGLFCVEDQDYRPRARAAYNECQCGGDMPGRCPGPEFCPMCVDDDDIEGDDDGDDAEERDEA